MYELTLMNTGEHQISQPTQSAITRKVTSSGAIGVFSDIFLNIYSHKIDLTVLHPVVFVDPEFPRMTVNFPIMY